MLQCTSKPVCPVIVNFQIQRTTNVCKSFSSLVYQMLCCSESTVIIINYYFVGRDIRCYTIKKDQRNLLFRKQPEMIIIQCLHAKRNNNTVYTIGKKSLCN